MKFSKICVVTILCLCLMVGAVSADNNTTVLDYNETVLENETVVLEEYVMPYRMTEQYTQDVDRWYAYYKGIGELTSGLRTKIYNHLMDSSLSWDAKQKLIKPLMGWDFRLECYMDESKRTINEETGEVTYDLGLGNWWAKLFGNGIEEHLLPQTIAEGDALYKVYCDNFEQYVLALHDAGDP